MIACSSCAHENPNGASFCEGCGAKLSDPRKAAIEADAVEAEFRLDQVKKARGAFLVVGVLQVVGGLIAGATAPTGDGAFYLVAELVVAAVFFGLAWWCSHQPFAAAIVGLFVFAGLHLTAALLDPSAIYKGIIVKVIVIVMLVRAIKAGFEYRQFVRSRGMG
jgi:hypothetical protein